MTEEQKANFARYAELKKIAKDAKTEIEKLAQPLLALMQEKGLDKIEADTGSFSIFGRSTWKYSEKVESMAAAVKHQQETEVADGTAKREDTVYMKFTFKKPPAT